LPSRVSLAIPGGFQLGNGQSLLESENDAEHLSIFKDNGNALE
jgi:hypothetical protein